MTRSIALALFATSSLASAQVLTSEVQKIEPSVSTTFTRFGSAIIQDADRVAIGAPSGAGAVETWTFDGANWVFEQRLAPSGATPSDRMGSSLDLEGDVLLAGAPDNSTFGISSGAAYVFRRTGGVWMQEQQLLTFDMQQGFKFGADVDLDGDQLVIGGLAQTVGNLPGVYVYEYDGSSWVLEQKVSHTGALPGQAFGRGVSLVGDRLYVSDFERIHQFERGVTGWTKVGEIVPPLGGFIGADFEVSGDRLVMTHPRGFSTFGFCTPFTRSGGVWTAGPSFDSGDPEAGDNFGRRVSLDGEWLLVSAEGRDWAHPLNPLSDSGSAFLFRDVAGSWMRVAELVPSDPHNGDYAGIDVSVEGERLLVGSRTPGYEGVQIGAVYSFDLATDVVGTSLCFGDGSGCTPCPCGNEAPLGTPAGCAHGEGGAAQLVATGNPSAMNDTLRFDLSGATSRTFALLVAGGQLLPTAGPCPPGSGVTGPTLDGLRCVGGGTLRLGTRPTNPIGTTVRPWGGWNGDLIVQGGFVAGQTWHFQATYRDLLSTGCGTGLNTSQAISIAIGL